MPHDRELRPAAAGLRRARRRLGGHVRCVVAAGVRPLPGAHRHGPVAGGALRGRPLGRGRGVPADAHQVAHAGGARRARPLDRVVAGADGVRRALRRDRRPAARPLLVLGHPGVREPRRGRRRPGAPAPARPVRGDARLGADHRARGAGAHAPVGPARRGRRPRRRPGHRGGGGAAPPVRAPRSPARGLTPHPPRRG